MSTKTQTVKRTFWAVAAFYILIACEFFYMASPFAIYFYALYGPALNFVNRIPLLAWLGSAFLPHIVPETASPLVNALPIAGGILFVIGFLGFVVGACQVYYTKLARRGAVTGGIYNIVRHPQYACLMLSGFGLLLMWPRFIALIVFITMCFAYNFLAKAEESECEAKFGSPYVEYKNKTNMFLLFRLPLADRLPSLPPSGLKRYLTIVGLWAAICVIGIGIAIGLRNISLDSIYGLYTQDAAYVSLEKMDQTALERIVAIALADTQVQKGLEANSKDDARFINYILPSTWYISEIPMNVVSGSRGGHYHPADYDNNLYRIVFTQAKLRTRQTAEGKDILLNTENRTPILEAVIDLRQAQVVEILLPGKTVKYEGIPVPVY